MATVTARYLITQALKLLRVIDPNQQLKSADAADGLATLNDLVDAWYIEKLYVMATTKVSASFAGQSATIGLTGTFNVVAPVKINHAFFRRADEDRELQVLNAEQYDAIALKSLSDQFPSKLYYERTVPLGTIKVWPVPSMLTTYFLDLDVRLSQFATMDAVYDVGDGYRSALKFALAEQLATIFSKPVNPDLRRNISRAKRSLKRSNLVVPTVEIETPSPSNRRTDVTSGTFPYP